MCNGKGQTEVHSVWDLSIAVVCALLSDTLLSPARWRVSGIPEQDVAGQYRGRGAEPHEAHGGQQDTGALDTSSSNSGGG